MVERAVEGFLTAHLGGMATLGPAARMPVLDALEGEGLMLRSMKELEGYAIRATDGTIGHVKDFYFDDESWVIRYFVVDTGAWLLEPKGADLAHCDRTPELERTGAVRLAHESTGRGQPRHRHQTAGLEIHEIRHLRYYGYSYYWGGTGLWGGVDDPSMMLMTGYDGFVPTPHGQQTEAEKACASAEAARHQNDDPHLRSCKAATGYHIEATDGGIGHVQGMLVYEDSWVIRYLVADTSNWWLGHPVLIARRWIQNVSWSEETVSVNLTRQAVKDAPQYDSERTRPESWSGTSLNIMDIPAIGQPMRNVNPMDPVRKPKR